MAEPTDIEHLARDYLQLWQEHMSAIATDENAAETMAKTMALMNSGAATFAKAMADAAQSSGIDPTAKQDSAAPHGVSPSSPDDKPHSDSPPASGLSSDHADANVAQLLERIAELEKRVAELERSDRA